MKNTNYDNALTNLEEEKEIKLLVKGLLESIDQLNNLKNNSLLTENKKVLLEVSLWDNVKYYLGKLGRYKAGGKIFGKGKIDQEAGAKIQAIIDKKGNEFIKQLHDSIKAENAKDKGEFPNNRDPEIFLNIVLSIATVYDNIVAATKLKPNEKGYLAIDIANNIISDLREYVKKYLDVDVNWVSSIMDSEEDKVEEKEVLITDSDEDFDVTQIDKTAKPEPNKPTHHFPLNAGEECSLCHGEGCKECHGTGKVPSEYMAEDRAADVRTQLQAKGGDEKIDSERMKTLKSWRLPIALMGAGASFGALSWLIEWMFPAEEITTYTPQQVSELSEETIGRVKPLDGMTQTFNSIPSLGANLTPQSSPDEVINVLSKIGNGNAQMGVDIVTQQGGIFRDPELAHQTLSELVKNPNAHGDTLKEVFQGNWAGTDKTVGDTLVTLPGGTIKMMVVKVFTRWIRNTIIKKSAVALFAGPILKTLGIGLLGAGALVKLFREKGKRQSRAKTLNDLLQSLQYVKGEPVLDETPVQGDEQKEEPVKGGDEGKGKGGPMDDDLYNSLRNLFRFIVSTEKQFGAGPKKESVDELFNFDSLLTEAVYFRDKELVNYLNKNVSPKRVKAFENLLNRVEQIRNKIRNMKNTGDKVFDSLIAGCKDNPIYLTDFTKMFNIASTNRQDYTNMAKFINGIFDEIRNSKYKKLPLIDKLGSMGKVVSDKDDLNEDDPRGGRSQFEKHAQDRSKFRKHLMEFLNDSIALFQYMLKKRKELAASGGQKTNLDKQKKKLNIQSNTQKSKPSGPTKYGSSMSESKNKENNFLNEELLRIKKLMK